MTVNPLSRARRGLGVLALGTLMAMLSGCVIASPGNPGGDQPSEGTVRGHVTTARGAPVAGAEVFADSVQFYNANITATTDRNGFYEIQLGSTHPGPWRIGGYMPIDLDGSIVRMALHPESTAQFLTAEGAIRNLEWRLSGSTVEGGHYGSDVWVYSDLSGEDVPIDNVELTLVPVGPLVDGSAGETIVRTPRVNRIGDVPVGIYTASARYVDVTTSVDLLIRVRDTGSHALTVTTPFSLSRYDTLHLEFEVLWP